jgi:CcmD family protein
MGNENGLILLGIGYGIVWLGILGYLIYVFTRLRSVENELKSLIDMSTRQQSDTELSDID